MERSRNQDKLSPKEKLYVYGGGLLLAGALVGVALSNNGPGNLDNYPKTTEVVTANAPTNTIEGLAIEANGPMDENTLMAVDDFLIKENHGSTIVIPGEPLQVPVVQSHNHKK